ncbi:phosphodiesterase [Variovorax sp. LT1R16]|uniref:phosphodiesterase n=1 Tax=Variovorax sp. LT1R16 TaxID=3443728 RepID=UPI003F44D747
MLKFIHITDIHLVEQGRALYGHDPGKRFERCIDSVIAEHADASFCVITGDLAHVGHPDAYRQLSVQCARLPMPVHLILGNHDSRPNFRERFRQVPVDHNGFVQYEQAVGKFRGLFLDTNEPGTHSGVFCEQRANWLAQRLAEDDAPVLLFMHHPAFPLGIPVMDRIGLVDKEWLLTALKGHEHRIKHLFFGHIHRPISGTWRGIPFSTLRGTNHQVALHVQESEDIPGSFEPPQYGVVLIDEESVIVHLHEFLDHSERFWLGA